MEATRRVRPIADRVDRAFELAAQTGRTPVALALGKEDHPAFLLWTRTALGDAPDLKARYRGVPVRHLKNLFLSRLELKTQAGAPNAILI